MKLRRIHLFELEDQPWCPTVIRDLATDYLHFIETKFELHRPVVGLLSEALRATKSDRVVDLCSGGGGPIPALQKALAAEGLTVHFTLTDRFPNVQAFQQAAINSRGRIAFVAELVDAKAVPARLSGFRTLFNSFHHFRPTDAVAILRDAAEAGQPIGIFEIPDRTLRTIVPVMLLTPFMVALATPFIRPFRWSRLLWTYLVPVVTLTCWWDGIVSQLRAYTPAELELLANSMATGGYSWRAGQCANLVHSRPPDLPAGLSKQPQEHTCPLKPCFLRVRSWRTAHLQVSRVRAHREFNCSGRLSVR